MELARRAIAKAEWGSARTVCARLCTGAKPGRSRIASTSLTSVGRGSAHRSATFPGASRALGLARRTGARTTMADFRRAGFPAARSARIGLPSTACGLSSVSFAAFAVLLSPAVARARITRRTPQSVHPSAAGLSSSPARGASPRRAASARLSRTTPLAGVGTTGATGLTRRTSLGDGRSFTLLGLFATDDEMEREQGREQWGC